MAWQRERHRPGRCVGILALDAHIRLADGPRLVIPVLTINHGVGLGVEIADVMLDHGQHTTGTAGGIVDGLHDMAVRKVLFRGCGGSPTSHPCH